MTNFLKKFEPIDFIAVVTIVGGLVLKFFGIDGLVGTILTTIVLFYFGKKEVVDKIREKHLPEAKSETVEEAIKRIANDEGVDPNLAVRVAKCESGLDPGAININPRGSRDRGLFQINDRWHPEVSDECAFDVERSTRFFCQAFKNGNLSWWDATRKCWKL
ncbi:MAG: transglycosylase SLT domain-containing protein [Candidatus Eisenbacteria sp.]|nr:transglycosylase SLT domain-containing protein [Candidatus Eisenbacteria bacterium]